MSNSKIVTVIDTDYVFCHGNNTKYMQFTQEYHDQFIKSNSFEHPIVYMKIKPLLDYTICPYCSTQFFISRNKIPKTIS